MTTAFPLTWPMGFARTQAKTYSKFRTGFPVATANVMESLRKFAKETNRDVSNVIVSSNVTMMNDRPRDGGVAVYFDWDNSNCCIAVDRYGTPAANLQAIHHVIEAERTKMRHGGLNIVRAAFRGYTALPPPKGPDGQIAAPWWMVLGFPDELAATLEAAEAKYRELVKTTHPDAGGDAVKFAAVADAIRQAREVLRG